MYGLGEVFGGAGLERFDSGGDVGVPREHENGEVAVGGAQPSGYLDTVEIRHDEVGDDRVGGLLGMARQQRVRAIEHLGPHPPRAQVGGYELGVHQIVVEDVDFGVHDSNILSCAR